jgi:hypothetical protein
VVQLQGFPASDNPSQCLSGRMLLYPRTRASRPTQDQYLTAPAPPYGFSATRNSPFSEAPDSVFTVGEVSEWSDITQHDEWFPVPVDVMVAKGCDGVLSRLAQDSVEEGILPLPKVGPSIMGDEALKRHRVGGHERSEAAHRVREGICGLVGASGSIGF